MYIPKQFEVHDHEELIRFIKENGFGILFTKEKGVAEATHLPFLYKDEGEYGTLYGHFALANEHWKNIKEEVLVVFPGPHAYISPTWYEEEDTVPTWNYVAVHVYGEFQLIEDPQELKSMMEELVAFFESKLEHPWETDLNSETNQRQMKYIKGFKIKIRMIQGKWKLNQHHPIARQKRTIQHLKKTDMYDSKEIARLMECNIRQISK